MLHVIWHCGQVGETFGRGNFAKLVVRQDLLKTLRVDVEENAVVLVAHQAVFPPSAKQGGEARVWKLSERFPESGDLDTSHV